MLPSFYWEMLDAAAHRMNEAEDRPRFGAHRRCIPQSDTTAQSFRLRLWFIELQWCSAVMHWAFSGAYKWELWRRLVMISSALLICLLPWNYLWESIDIIHSLDSKDSSTALHPLLFFLLIVVVAQQVISQIMAFSANRSRFINLE